MMIRNLGWIFLKLLAVSIVALPTSYAAVYKCVDDQGNTSFSSIPCPTKKITGDSEAHKLWKELKAFSTRGRLIVRTIGADVESIKACRIRSNEFKEDLAVLGEKVEKLEQEHADIRRAYRALQDCGVCQARGMGQCSKADRLLNSAKNALVEIPEKQPPPWVRKRWKKQ
ncbi:MAG: DUF4124 domain-containing protein [Exilibacterium sp.]